MSHPLVLDARTATAHFPGIGRYAVNLARAIGPLLKQEEHLILLRDPTQPSPWDLTGFTGDQVQIVDVLCSPFSLRQQWAVPRLLRCLHADLYHSPYYLMPYRPGRPTLLTVHDLIPLLLPQHSTAQARLLFRWAMAAALHTARHAIAVSEATQRDLLHHFHFPADQVSVIPEAADPTFHPRSLAEIEAVRRKYDLPETFILYLGSNKPHKNLTRLIEAWSRLTPHTSRLTLVLAGPWDPRYPEPHLQAERLGLENTCWLGLVPEADLPALYSAATLFVFPSLYEGFGLPVLEAMACGTPVACSDKSSLPELVADAALLFDPADPVAIADALRHLLSDADLRADLRQRALRRAALFSWQHTAQETLQVYRQMLD